MKINATGSRRGWGKKDYLFHSFGYTEFIGVCTTL